jgi:hypothetical protein
MKAHRHGRLIGDAKMACRSSSRFILMNALAYTKILGVVIAEQLWRAPSRRRSLTAGGRRADGRSQT